MGHLTLMAKERGITPAMKMVYKYLGIYGSLPWLGDVAMLRIGLLFSSAFGSPHGP